MYITNTVKFGYDEHLGTGLKIKSVCHNWD